MGQSMLDCPITINIGEEMDYNEKHLLNKLEADNSPMEFTLFKEDNKAENFSSLFHKKFDELEDQVISNQHIKAVQ